MVWRWPIRKRASLETEPSLGNRTPSVHETPTREFVAHIPAGEGSVHDKPTREFAAHPDPNGELAVEADESTQPVALEQSGPMSVRAFDDEGTSPRALPALPLDRRQ